MKIFTGNVISAKMDKTVTVVVERVIVHPVYKKRFKRMKKYHLHDEMGAKVGDSVKFTACKPYSKMKKWKLIEIIDKNSKPSKKGGDLKPKTKK